MPIGNAVQRGSSVYVYNDKGSQIGSIPAGNGPKDGLKGFTGATVSVRRGNTIYLYNEKCSQTGQTPAGKD